MKRIALVVHTLAIFLVSFSIGETQQSVFFNIETSTGSDTLWVGAPSDIIFNVDPNGHVPFGLVFPMEFTFSTPGLLGNLTNSNIVMTPEIVDIFELTHIAKLNWWDGSGNDSLLVAFIDGGGDNYTDSGEVWRLSVVIDTPGVFSFDSTVLPPANRWDAIARTGNSIPFEIINYGRQYHVTFLNGDVNADGKLTAADLIYYINWNFKGQTPPPVCDGIGDVNCSEDTTPADIIYLVSHIFKSGPPPCDITTLIPDVWVCP
jgi:hypothetical protein